MAHEVEAMFSVKKIPWHGKGVILNDAPNAEEAMIQGGLNWNVKKSQAFILGPDGQQIPMKGQYGIIRDNDNTILGRSGEFFEPLQNADAFKFFDPFIESGAATFESGGSLQEGKKVWVLAKINSSPIEPVKNDVSNKYLLLTNTHSVGTSVKALPTLIRVVCANTLRAALGAGETAGNVYRVAHSSQTMTKLSAVQETIAKTEDSFKRVAALYEAMGKKKVSAKVADDYFSQVFSWSEYGTKEDSERRKTYEAKQKENILKLFEIGRGTDISGVKGTLWGAYNAVTEYITHEAGRQENRLYNELFGNGMKINQKAFSIAQEVLVA